MDDPSFEGLIERVSRPVFRKDGHLASALLTSGIQYMLDNHDNPAALKEEHRMLLRDLKENNRTMLHPKYVYSWFMNNMDRLQGHNHAPELSLLLQAANMATETSVSDYTGIQIDWRTKTTEFLQAVFNVKSEMDTIFDNVTFSTTFRQAWSLGTVSGCAYGNLHKIEVTTSFIITHSHLAGARDMINSWFDILLAALSDKWKYPGHNLYLEVEELINAVAEHSRLDAVGLYELTKRWPSLAISCILRDREGDSTFYKSITEDIEHMLDTRFGQFLTRSPRTDFDVHLNLELTGLWKCFGFPIINMEKSIRTWISKGAVLKPNLDEAARRLDDMFKLTFCRKWPVIHSYGNMSNRLRDKATRNTWEEDARFPWTSSGMSGVRFGTCLPFNMHVDITDLLTDKSIIPSRDQWVYEFDSQVHRTLYGKFPVGPPSTSKSAVVALLDKEEVSVQEIITCIDSGAVPDSWKVIVCVSKEREPKEERARLYAKQTPEMRLYQTATEGGIAEQILPYVPQQTMTMGEEKLTRIIQRMTSPRPDSTCHEFKYVVIDFSSWCTNFRYELSTPTFKSFDDLFGFNNVYSYTHLFHLSSILLFQNRFCPPKQREDGLPEEGTRCVYGPEAWQEGLRQKGWTVITIMLINLVAEKCGTSAFLIGQGDNQVLLLRVPRPDILRSLNMSSGQYVDWFVQELVLESNRCGLPIKEEETWRSSHLFEYSREYHYKGTQVSSSLKKASRLASEANQTIPTLNGDLTALYSTGTSYASKDHQPMTAYYVTSVEALYLIRKDMPWTKERPIGVSVMAILTSRLQVGLYSYFCTRAVQDGLTTSLYLIHTCTHNDRLYPHVHTWLNLNMGGKDWEALIKDPQCLPLRLPLQPESLVRREVKAGITSIVKNKMIAALFSSNIEKDKEDLIHTLSNIRPVNPRLLNKLYALSNLGIQEKYLGKYSNTRSIQKLAFKMWSDEQDFIVWMRTQGRTISIRYELNKGNEEWVLRIKMCVCTTQLAHQLRYEGWGEVLEGVTMPAQQEQTTLHNWESVPSTWRPQSILIHLDDSVPVPVQRRRRAPLQVMEVGSTVTNIKALVEIRAWMSSSSSLVALVDKLIEEKTSITLPQLLAYARQVYSGTISHRLSCPAPSPCYVKTGPYLFSVRLAQV